MNFLRRLLAVAIVFLPTLTLAQSADQNRYDLTLLDAPFNGIGGAPSMSQSLSWSTSMYGYLHQTIYDSESFLPGLKNEYRIWALIPVDLILEYLPLGTSWVHEEWHRASLSRRGYSSYNEVYKLQLFASTIKVSRLADQDLTEFKARHPAEFIRMSSAGIESQVEQNLEFSKRKFFLRNDSYDDFTMLLNSFSTWGYFNLCASSAADKETDEANKEEVNIADRDFTGLDCLAWAYDLHRPDEAYSARGTHPSGSGTDRYIRWSDLNSQEQSYLKQQSYLALLNFFNPIMWGKDAYSANDPLNKLPISWNWGLQHYPTSFGHQVGLNYFARQGVFNFLFSLYANSNSARTFPGWDLQVSRVPLRTSIPLQLSTHVSYWQQPKDQRFQTNDSEPGMLWAFRLHWAAAKNFEIFNELWNKDPGWVSGNVELERAWGNSFGTTLVF